MSAALALQAGGAALSSIMGLIGHFVSQGDREKANALLEQAYQQYGDVVFDELPNFAPELLGPSAMAGITTAPRLKEAQMRSLDTLGEIESAGGLLTADKAVLNQLNRQSEKAASDRQAQILENMQRRGTGGSGAELAAQLSGGQAAAERAQQYGLTTAGQAQQRAIDAIMGRGQLAGNIRGQEFGEKSAQAQAADAIARYNAGAKERFGEREIDRARYKNDMTARKADMKLKGATGQAGVYGNRGEQTRGLYSGIGSAVSAGMGAGGQYMREEDQFNQWLERQKKGGG